MRIPTGWRNTVKLATSWRWHSVARWLMVGLCFSVSSMGLLYVLVDRIRLPLVFSTLLAAELSTLLRFFVNDRWVFRNRAPTWKGLWQYHGANIGGFVIWWSISNLLPHWGMHYLLAAAAGTAGSIGFSMVSNFLWIWSSGEKATSAPEARAGDVVRVIGRDDDLLSLPYRILTPSVESATLQPSESKMKSILRIDEDNPGG